MPADTLCVLGCGTMGVAILSGLLEARAGGTPGLPTRIIGCVKQDASAARLRSLFATGDGASAVEVVVRDNALAVGQSDIVILGSKPQVAVSLISAPEMREALRGKVLISICAGLTLDQLSDAVDTSTRCIRAMPNTPTKIRKGMTVISAGPSVSSEHLHVAETIFSTLGRCRVLEEKHLDAVTGLSGSGPAFACVVLEALADGGVMMGLPRGVAIELASQALLGAASMVLETGEHPSAIKDSVTTPGGCTIAGLLTMEDGRIRSTLARTVEEAARVAKDLGGGGSGGSGRGKKD